MARIAELPLAGPITGDETLPVVQDGTTKRTNVAAFLGDSAAIAIAAATADANTARDKAQEARDEAVPAAVSSVGARDSALIYKVAAEDAQADTAADRTATAGHRATVEALLVAAQNAAATAIAAAAGVGPVTAITQAQLFDLGGSLNVNGTGMALPNSDHNIALGVISSRGREPLRGASAANTRKAFAAGREGMAYFDGYDSVGLSAWRSLYYTTGRNAVGIGVHAAEATNMAGKEIGGSGVRASGSFPFSSLPNDGDWIEVNGVRFIARPAAATATEFTIAGTISATIDSALAKIVGSADGRLQGLLFRKSAAGTAIEVLAVGAGTWANAVTLEVSGAGLARSAATLTGGTSLTNDGNQDNYTGLIGIGVAAAKRFDSVRARAPYGAYFVSGPASIGAAFTIGVGTTVSAAATTLKRFTCVAAGATGLQFNQGADAASQIVNIVSALQAYAAANPTHTATNSVDFYASQRGIEIVHKTASVAGNFYRTSVDFGTGITAQSPFLHGGYNAAVTPPIAIGQNIEAGMGSNIVVVGNAAARGIQSQQAITLGTGSGAWSIGENNFYLFGSGQSVIGSNNVLVGPTLGSAAVQSYMPVASVSPTGLITLQQPMTDPQAVIGRRFTVWQRNQVTASDLIKQDGTNLSNPSMRCRIESPRTLQIIDFTDGDGPTGQAVYSVAGTATNVEVALFYAPLNFANSWGDTPESSTFHIGQQRQGRATVRASRLEMPFGRWQVAALTAAAAHAAGNLLFPTANGNFADGDLVTVNGVVFTAKAAAAFAVPNTAMIRWFRIGADMHESLQNLIACLRNSDDDTANARLYRIATFWVSAQTGSGWRLNWRVTGRLASGNSFTVTTSKAGATGGTSSGGTAGTLLLAAAASNPPVMDGERRQITLGGQPCDAIYSAALDDYQITYLGS